MHAMKLKRGLKSTLAYTLNIFIMENDRRLLAPLIKVYIQAIKLPLESMFCTRHTHKSLTFPGNITLYRIVGYILFGEKLLP